MKSGKEAIVWVTLCIGLVLAATAFSRGFIADDEPNLVVSPKSLDIGPTKSGETRRPISISVSNRGSRPASILSLHATCGCMRFNPLETQSIRRGESIRVTGSVSLPFVNDRIAAIDIETSAQSITVPLRIRPRVMEKPLLQDVPSLLILTGTNSDEMIAHDFSVKVIEPVDQVNSPVSAVEVSLPNSSVEILKQDDVEVLNSIQARRTVAMRLTTFPPAASDKRNRGRMRFLRSDGERFEASIQLVVELRPILRFVPAVLTFDLSRSDFPMEKQLLVLAETDFSIQRIGGCDDSITANVISSNDPSTRQEQLKVTIHDSSFSERNLIIESEEFPGKQFTLPVRIIESEPALTLSNVSN